MGLEGEFGCDSECYSLMMSIPIAGARDIEAYIFSVNYVAMRSLRDLWEVLFVLELRVASVDGELVDQNPNCLQIGKRTQIRHPRCDTGAIDSLHDSAVRWHANYDDSVPNATYTDVTVLLPLRVSVKAIYHTRITILDQYNATECPQNACLPFQ